MSSPFHDVIYHAAVNGHAQCICTPGCISELSGLTSFSYLCKLWSDGQVTDRRTVLCFNLTVEGHSYLTLFVKLKLVSIMSVTWHFYLCIYIYLPVIPALCICEYAMCLNMFLTFTFGIEDGTWFEGFEGKFYILCSQPYTYYLCILHR